MKCFPIEVCAGSVKCHGEIIHFSAFSFAMNPLSLYVTTCQMVLQSRTDDPSAWSEISRSLTSLRQSLTCCVCNKVLSNPTCSSDYRCNHSVCKSCVGSKMNLDINCDLCSDYSKFSDNIQLCLVVQCYKKLCEYISSLSFHRKLGGFNGGTMSNLSQMVQEAVGIDCDNPSVSVVNNGNIHNVVTNLLPGVEIKDWKNEVGQASTDRETSIVNGNGSIYSVKVNDNATKIMIKRTLSESSGSETSSCEADESLQNNFNVLDGTISLEVAKSVRPKKRGCRCGLATRNPGQLTCCGQRCLCYVDRKACDQCKCRGCRNPNKYLVSSGSMQGSSRERSEIEMYIENEISTNGNSDN